MPKVVSGNIYKIIPIDDANPGILYQPEALIANYETGRWIQSGESIYLYQPEIGLCLGEYKTNTNNLYYIFFIFGKKYFTPDWDEVMFKEIKCL